MASIHTAPGRAVDMAVAPSPVPLEVQEETFFEPELNITQMFVHFRDLPGGYARHLRPSRVKKLIATFDRSAMGPVLLSMRNTDPETFAIIDGQHRVEVAKHYGIKRIPAYVYVDLTIEREADLYRKFGDYLKQTALDKYMAALAAGDQHTRTIDSIVHTIGLHVAAGTGGRVKNGIQAAEALYNIAEGNRYGLLAKTLDLVHSIFEGEPRAYVGPVLHGFAAFLERYADDSRLQRKQLVERVRELGWQRFKTKQVARLGLDGNSAATAWGKALLEVHNYRLSANALPEWQGKVVTPEHKAKSAENLLRHAVPAAIHARKIRAATPEAEERRAAIREKQKLAKRAQRARARAERNGLV